MTRTITFLTLVFIIILASCGPEQQSGIDRLIVRSKQDPQRINPLLHSDTYSRQIYQHVMLMLGDFDPITLEFEPLLMEKIPEARAINTDEHKGKYAYDFTLLSDAVWSDGGPVTAEDYLFTFKLMYHKGVNVAGYKAYYSKLINDIIVDTSNPKKFTVIVNNKKMDALVAICGVELYPRHFYDPNGALTNYSLKELEDDAAYDGLVAADPALGGFGTQFQDVKYSREIVEGAGPYELSSWETDQFVRLTKKENYWGDKYSDRIPLNAYPKEIIYQIVEDDVVAINQLKSGELDLVPLQSTTGARFEELKNDELLQSSYDFYTPQLMRFYSLILNNESPYLNDKRVRRALAHLIDIPRIIEVVEGGQGKQAVTIISEMKSYYNSKLKPILFDEVKAKELLAEAGWSDTDGDGFIDKPINGVKRNMSLRFFSSGSALAERLSLAMKEGAAKAGIDINIITQSTKITRTKHQRTGDFEITAGVTTMSEIDQPSRSWHSVNIGGAGINFQRFSNYEADEIMTQIDGDVDDQTKHNLFIRLQEIIYEEQPVIFLYAPVEKLVVKNTYEPLITSRRPGYVPNAFKPAQ